MKKNKKVQSKFTNFCSKVRKNFISVVSNPKKTFITMINRSREIIKNNILFFVFVFVTLFSGILVRYFTIHTIENLIDIKPFLADLAVATILGGICFFFKEKNRFIYLFTMSIILTAICTINSLYYTFYTSYVSVSWVGTLKYLFQVGDAVTKNVMKITDFIYFLAPITLFITNWRIKKTQRFKNKDKQRRNKDKAFVSIGSGFAVFILFVCMLNSLEIGRFIKQWNREYIVMKFGIYTYQINDIVKSIEPKITSLFGYDSAVKNFNEYYKDRSDTQTEKNKYTNIFEGKNIIVIHGESIQSFTMDLKFNGQEVTPNLNKLASKSINFTNYYSQVSVGTSSDTEFTFNTSLMPTNNGTAFVSYFDREYVSIPKLLKEKGYYNFSMHANNGSYWNRDVMHKSLGYDHFYSKKEYEIDEVIGLGLSDKSFFRQSIEKIKQINEQGKPYYGTVIMLSNHTPFADVDKYGEFDVDIKEKAINPETGKLEDVIYPYMEDTKMGNYLKSVHYADSALGEFLDGLDKAGILENTVIVLYGDHDARLSKSEFNRLYNYDKATDGILDSENENYKEIDYYQYELLRKVPFMIYSKGNENLHQDVSTVMGMYDAMPTLGNMFGFYNKFQLGRDIFNHLDDNIVVFPNGNWMTNKVYYNTQKGEQLVLKDAIISDEYLQENIKYSEKLLQASNALIVYDLIKKQNEIIKSETDYIEEKVID